MTEKKAERPENPPLFDVCEAHFEDTPTEYRTKITLRDLFAAAALAGLEASLGPEAQSTPEIGAEYAYKRADAMLAERAKR